MQGECFSISSFFAFPDQQIAVILAAPHPYRPPLMLRWLCYLLSFTDNMSLITVPKRRGAYYPGRDYS